jgi:galactose mutarotase-like enzyme
MSYICGTNINLTIKCNTQNDTFEFYESSPTGACAFTMEEDLEADLEFPWYASATGGTVTVTFEPASALDVISIDHESSGGSVTISEDPAHSFIITYTGSAEPSCDFEIWNPNNSYNPKPKVILLPKPQSGPPTK